VWTLPRVRKLIKDLTGVTYGVSGVWYVMRRLNWSVQRPGRRALQRDEEAIKRWQRETWPALKKTRDGNDD
jgi:transposase